MDVEAHRAAQSDCPDRNCEIQQGQNTCFSEGFFQGVAQAEMLELNACHLCMLKPVCTQSEGTCLEENASQAVPGAVPYPWLPWSLWRQPNPQTLPKEIQTKPRPLGTAGNSR